METLIWHKSCDRTSTPDWEPVCNRERFYICTVLHQHVNELAHESAKVLAALILICLNCPLWVLQCEVQYSHGITVSSQWSLFMMSKCLSHQCSGYGCSQTLCHMACLACCSTSVLICWGWPKVCPQFPLCCLPCLLMDTWSTPKLCNGQPKRYMCTYLCGVLT